jgi:F-type H+-transporting ATPase subunit delta
LRERVVARRYARALLAIGYREGKMEEILAELKGVKELFQEVPVFWKAVSLPIYPVENRKKVLKEVLKKAGFSQTVIRFLEILVEKERISLFTIIYSIFQELTDRAQNRMRGTLFTAQPLSDSDFEKIKETLAAYMKKDLILQSEVDTSLIGGVMAKIGGIVVDGSVQGELNRFREKLLTG